MTETQPLGEAWSEALPESHREALSNAFDSLCDGFVEDLALTASGDVAFADTDSGSLLPIRLKKHYSEGFARRFFLCFATVGWKLAQPDEMTPSCVAEELAVHILVTEATRILAEEGEDPDYGAFEDLYLQDADVELLYDLSFDGIEDTKTAEDLGMDHLHFEDWFKPFLNATSAVHPYSAGV